MYLSLLTIPYVLFDCVLRRIHSLLDYSVCFVWLCPPSDTFPSWLFRMFCLTVSSVGYIPFLTIPYVLFDCVLRRVHSLLDYSVCFVWLCPPSYIPFLTIPYVLFDCVLRRIHSLLDYSVCFVWLCPPSDTFPSWLFRMFCLTVSSVGYIPFLTIPYVLFDCVLRRIHSLLDYSVCFVWLCPPSDTFPSWLFRMFCLTVSSVGYIPFLANRTRLRKHLHASIGFSHLELLLFTVLIIDCLDMCTFIFLCTVLSHFPNFQLKPIPCLPQIVFCFKFISSTCLLFSFRQLSPSWWIFIILILAIDLAIPWRFSQQFL